MAGPDLRGNFIVRAIMKEYGLEGGFIVRAIIEKSGLGRRIIVKATMKKYYNLEYIN